MLYHLYIISSIYLEFLWVCGIRWDSNLIFFYQINEFLDSVGWNFNFFSIDLEGLFSCYLKKKKKDVLAKFLPGKFSAVNLSATCTWVIERERVKTSRTGKKANAPVWRATWFLEACRFQKWKLYNHVTVLLLFFPKSLLLSHLLMEEELANQTWEVICKPSGIISKQPSQIHFLSHMANFTDREYFRGKYSLLYKVALICA